MEWIPIVFVTFKVLVLATGMYYAIKWHYDQGKKEKEQAMERRAVLRAGIKIAIGFTFLLVAVGFLAFSLAGKLGLDLSF